MKRRDFIKLAGLSAPLLPNLLKTTEKPMRPNILWLTIEDTSAYEFACYGNPHTRTPEVDRLAREGIQFTSAISNAPYCSPARSTIISGCYATTYGNDEHRQARAVPVERYFFPRLLRQAGYFCTNNSKTDYNVAKDQWETIRAQVWDECHPRATYSSPAREPGQPFFSVFNHTLTHMSILTTVTTTGRKSSRFNPDALQLPPHVPDLPEIRADYAVHLDAVEKIDQWVGWMRADLEKQGLAEDTIIFFYSDHGGCLPRGKAFNQESGMRVPMVVYFPPKWRHLAGLPVAAKTDRLVSFVDLAPTVLSLAGVPVPDYFQGKAFLGQAATAPRRFNYYFRCNTKEHYNPSRGVTDGKFRYVRFYTPHKPQAIRQWFQWQMPGQLAWDQHFIDEKCKPEHRQYYQPRPTEMLFDLENDFFELNNLAGKPEYREKLIELRNETADWVRRVPDLGFFHPEFRDYPNPTPLFERVRAEKYPLAELISAAEIASEGRAELLPQLQQYLQHPEPAFRFWGASGLATLAAHGHTQICPPELKQALNDSSLAVALTAAEALCYFGEFRAGLTFLLAHCRKHNAEAFMCLEEITLSRDRYLPPAQQAEIIREMEAILEKGANWEHRQKARSVLANFHKNPVVSVWPEADIPEKVKNHLGKYEQWQQFRPGFQF